MLLQEFHFWSQKDCEQYAGNIMYRYSLLWCVHVEVNICNPNLCAQVKVSLAYMENIHRLRDAKNQKCRKKNHNKLQLLDFSKR